MTTTPRLVQALAAGSAHRPRWIAPLDRPWLGQSSVLLAAPVAADVDAVRAAFAEFLDRHPASPIARRLDPVRGRWLPVPRSQRAAHAARVVTEVADPDPDDLAGHVRAHLDHAPDLPVWVAVSPTSVLSSINHALGDASTFTRLALALSSADAAGLDALANRAGVGSALRALRAGLPAHRREWVDYLRNRTGPPTPREVGDHQPARPGVAGTVLGRPALAQITKWRNANAKGVSITSVLTTLTHRALTAHGVPLHSGGAWALIDIRGLLGDGEPQWGNLSKSLFLTADLTDPAAVEAAMKQARATGRALPATVVGAVTGAVRTPRPPSPYSAPTDEIVLTFNSMPTLSGLAELNWLDTGPKRFFGFGPSTDPAGITVFAVRTRDHMELTASFDEAAVSAQTVEKALAALAEPTGLLAG
ncbi:hypothetical protein ACOBQX_05075 [Actinokineospora sp. G85]|uniref:hypothetical protein n=1 Tax=Actinokineospora sp. G85 TaxID=3406626 RepID=UPI003C73FE50